MAALLRFFSLTYAVTWTCFIAAGALSRGQGSAEGARVMLVSLLYFVGTFAPSFVALTLTARDEGRGGVRALLDRLFRWDVGARWYLFAAGYMVTIKLAVALVHRVALRAWPPFGAEAWYLIVAATIFSTVIGAQAGEEIGWRGYALPRLAAGMGLARGSVLLGVIWALWHLPLFFIPGVDKFGQSFPLYAIQVTALSVALAWLYAHTNGSLLLTMLMHSAVNQTLGIVPSAVPGATEVFSPDGSRVGWLTAAFLWIFGAYFLVRMPRTTPSVPNSATA